MMKNYDPNIMWGTHTIEVTLQQWEYKGKITTEIGGNCRGFSILESAKDEINQKSRSNCKFKIIEDSFCCELKDNKGNELEIEDELDNLDNYIVKIEIIDFKESEEK